MTNTVAFDTIPASIRHPGVYTEYNTRFAVNALPTNQQKVLIVAPMSGGVVRPLVPTQVFSDTEAERYFGAGSWAHLMSRIAIKNNPMLNLTVIGVEDDASGIAATATINFSGTAVSAGILTATIGGINYSIAATYGEASEDLAGRLSAVINGRLDCPVTASVNGQTLTLTAKCKGFIGNEIAIDTFTNAPGVSINLSYFNGGQKNALIKPALDKVAGEHYQIIISAFNDEVNAKALKDYVNVVSSPIEKMPAIGVLGFNGSMSAGTTLSAKLNSERLTVAWYKGCIENPALLAAAYGAVIAFEEDPARPLNTLALKGLSVVNEVARPNFTEKNQALYNGLTPIVVVNNQVQILRAITTCTQSASGTDDPAYLDLTTIRTLDYVRKAIEQRLLLRFPRDKLSSRTPAKVRSEILDVLYRLEKLEIVENVDAYKAKLVVVRNQQDVNRLDNAIPADVVNGLHIIANRIDLIL